MSTYRGPGPERPSGRMGSSLEQLHPDSYRELRKRHPEVQQLIFYVTQKLSPAEQAEFLRGLPPIIDEVVYEIGVDRERYEKKKMTREEQEHYTRLMIAKLSAKGAIYGSIVRALAELPSGASEEQVNETLTVTLGEMQQIVEGHQTRGETASPESGTLSDQLHKREKEE